MSRIGRPLTTETGKPRIVPRTLPRPETVPDALPPVTEPEKEPVKVGTPAESLIHRVASILGVHDDWVAGKVLEMAAGIEAVLNLGKKRKSTAAGPALVRGEVGLGASGSSRWDESS